MWVFSLIGFGVAFLAVTVAGSLLLCGLVSINGDRIREIGPWFERYATTMALTVPPAMAIGVVLTIAVNKTSSAAGGVDHCLSHPHHLHFCPVHGTAWSGEWWAIMLLALFLVTIAIQAFKMTRAHLKARRLIMQLRRISQPIEHARRSFLVPCSDCFAFTTGIISPSIFLSTGAWGKLDLQQRNAILAHEEAHVRQGDVWKRVVLRLLASLGCPGLSHAMVVRWAHATETICDRAALKHVSKPSKLASALLSLAQTRTRLQISDAAAFAAVDQICDRVHAIFAPGGSGRSAGKKLQLATLAIGASLFLFCVGHSNSIHHALESLLG